MATDPVAVVACCISVFSLLLQAVLFVFADRTQRELGTKAGELSRQIAALQGKSDAELASLDRRLSQRQFLLPLWDHMSNLNAIDPVHPVWPDVIKCVNTLELVGLCVEGEMVDRAVIERTFSSKFLELYDQVSQVQATPEAKSRDLKSGLLLLRENKAATTLYKQLRERESASGAIGPLTGSNNLT